MRVSHDAGRIALFHGFIAVAPLKPNPPDPSDPSDFALPRLHRRGPIEACVGPDRRVSRHPVLPRLHRRGPIEALSEAVRWLARYDLFHGFIAVAPLKLPGDKMG